MTTDERDAAERAPGLRLHPVRPCAMETIHSLRSGWPKAVPRGFSGAGRCGQGVSQQERDPVTQVGGGVF
jgi:hypothetical protein